MLSAAAVPSERESPVAWSIERQTHVVCVGNELARDDGVGVRVGRLLGALSLPSQAHLHFFPELGIDLIELLQEDARVIIVDALATGAAPGTCRIMDGDEVARRSQRPVACHAFGVAELFEIARNLRDNSRMADVCLVGVEAACVEGFSTTLTEAVLAALPEAVGIVLELMGASAAVIGRARQLAARSPAELPLRELCGE